MKKNHADTFRIIVKTLTGLEQVLAAELIGIGIEDPVLLNRAVEFRGTMEQLYKANYLCRTAMRVLKVIAEFTVTDEDELYRKIKSVKWSDLLSVDRTLAVDAVVNRSVITHSHYAALKVKDAIVDRFREETGKRPSVDPERPDLRINIHINGTQCDVSIDSSGESLHKRGYRRVQGEAPLSEVLAAGMIMLSGWDGKTDLLDPMCGSGTILTEACMISSGMPAGYFRKHFGFEKWKDFDAALWESIKTEANRKIIPVSAAVYGFDKSSRTLNAAHINLQAAGFEKQVELKAIAFEHSSPPSDEGIIVTNPPYGERIKSGDIRMLYKMMGDVLKKYYTGWQAWLITSDSSALKSVGLRTSKKITLFNGPLECRYVKYELYSGSKKAKYR